MEIILYQMPRNRELYLNKTTLLLEESILHASTAIVMPYN